MCFRYPCWKSRQFRTKQWVDRLHSACVLIMPTVGFCSFRTPYQAGVEYGCLFLLCACLERPTEFTILLHIFVSMHIGNRIKEVLKERGMTVTEFSQSLSCNRQNVYKIFDKHDINTDLLMHISIILDHDFFGEISEESRKCR